MGAEAESQCWRQKYETDAVAKGEELEMTKMKLTARLTEAEAAIDNLNAKLNQVEKAKGKVASEISDMTSSLDQAQVLNAAMERKAKQFDKVIGEWKGKVDRLSFDLDVSQKVVWFPNPLAAGSGLGERRGQNALFFL